MEQQQLNYMKIAYKMAEKAEKKDEVPVGAIIVKDNKIIAKAYNKREKNKNALHHAEILAINLACKKLKRWRLEDCTIYVTLEPCIMCAGAILNSRIKTIVIGCKDQKSGAFGSVLNSSDYFYNHTPNVVFGCLEDQCSNILKMFFKNLRNKKRVK
ncbi:MAG: nucleoside deaminase [Oscillospiraceae bacterium]